MMTKKQNFLYHWIDKFYTVPYWVKKIPQKRGFLLCDDEIVLNLLDTTPLDLALNEINCKLGHNANSKHLLTILKTKFNDINTDASRQAIAEALYCPEHEISDPAAINMRLLTILSIVNRDKFVDQWETYLGPGEFKNYVIPSSTLTYKFLSNVDKVSKAQVAFIRQLYQTFPLSESEFIKRLSPCATGYIGMVDQLAFGLHTLTIDLCQPQLHRNKIKRTIEGVSELELDRLELMGAPSVCYNQNNKIPSTFPPLFAIGFLYFTYPRYTDITEVPLSLLDTYYFSKTQEDKLVQSINHMTKEDFQDYLLYGLLAINFKDNDCAQQAINAMHRFLLPLKKRICKENWATLTRMKTKYSPISPAALARSRNGIQKHIMSGDLDYKTQIYAAKQKIYTTKRDQALQNKAEFDKFHVSLGEYTTFCEKHGISVDPKIFELIQSGIISIKELRKPLQKDTDPAKALKNKLNL